MKKYKIAICSCARLKSSRCKKKMIKKFNNTSLTDLMLQKLKKIQNNSEFDVFFAGYEKIFSKKSKKYNIPFVQRTKKSANIDGPASEIYNFFKNLDYDYFFLINACMPFLKVSTIMKLIKICKKENKPCFGVFTTKNFFINQKNKSINFKKNLRAINTKTVEPLKEFAHCFYFFKKEYFNKKGVFWNWNKVKYINLNKSLEYYDIDDEKDFKTASILAKVMINV